ncbi:aldose 1-epimerase family protein [Sphingomonas montana]|uniref:aldose 1-epimerase family protein n=1 Tax=Sphingomonas montana TaxID=1843236 RepID=UPI001F0A86E8|nr:aldose 1-epimerase family protein [Sphingomonas montana]
MTAAEQAAGQSDAGDVVIASSGLVVTISPDGAELQRIVDDAGRDLLWDGDPAFWTGRAPLLFPIVGGLEGGTYRVDGARYALPKHGFARTSRFETMECGADFARFRLTDSDATRAVYPFAFMLDILFTVAGDRLDMVATLTNPGKVVLPASFGFHPALRWPLPYGAGRADHVVRFDRPEPEPVRTVTPAGLIAAEPLSSPVEGNLLVLRDELFAVDAVIFDRLQSRGLWYGSAGGTGVRVDFEDMPDLGIWTKPGAGYLCIEPWQGMADPDGYAGDFREKPGVVEVAPGGSRQFAMRMEFGVRA